MSADPVEVAIQALDEMHETHDRGAPPVQLGIEWMTRHLGRPWFAWVVISGIITWIALNLTQLALTGSALDRPPFQGLKLVASLISLIMAIFILITQNRQNRIAHHRAEITLQMAVVTEQKVAKIIELLESLRRDDPNLPQRRDRTAESMAQATDVREAAEKVDEMGTTRA